MQTGFELYVVVLGSRVKVIVSAAFCNVDNCLAVDGDARKDTRPRRSREPIFEAQNALAPHDVVEWAEP